MNLFTGVISTVRDPVFPAATCGRKLTVHMVVSPRKHRPMRHGHVRVKGDRPTKPRKRLSVNKIE